MSGQNLSIYQSLVLTREPFADRAEFSVLQSWLRLSVTSGGQTMNNTCTANTEAYRAGHGEFRLAHNNVQRVVWRDIHPGPVTLAGLYEVSARDVPQDFAIMWHHEWITKASVGHQGKWFK